MSGFRKNILHSGSVREVLGVPCSVFRRQGTTRAKNYKILCLCFCRHARELYSVFGSFLAFRMVVPIDLETPSRQGRQGFLERFCVFASLFCTKSRALFFSKTQRFDFLSIFVAQTGVSDGLASGFVVWTNPVSFARSALVRVR